MIISHTPGKWTAVGRKLSVADCVIADRIEGRTDAEAEANAKFIAHACNSFKFLLLACKNSRSMFRRLAKEYINEYPSNKVGVDNCIKTLDFVNDIIMKAEKS